VGARVLVIPTPTGPARAHVHDAATAAARGTVVLGHGAGGGVDAADLLALASALPPAGFTVVLVEQPWRVAGRKVAGPPASLDAAWLVVLAGLAERGELAGPLLVVGGRSAGARVAVRTARAVGAHGAVVTAFPLHPPGRPERSRADEAREAGVPLLVLQGERDPFGRADEVRAAVPGARVVEIPSADHALRVPRSGPATAAEVSALLGEVTIRALAEWRSDQRR
jgi:predicted alpha/beta-hydrolase family hydrolase